MKLLTDSCRIECKRFFRSKKVMVFLAILLVALYFVHEGIVMQKGIVRGKSEFQEIEQQNIKLFFNYTQYGTFGFQLLYIPSGLSILFNNKDINCEQIALVDSGARLKIYHLTLGSNLFTEKSNILNDFSGVILFAVTIITLLWGLALAYSRKLFKVTSAFSNVKTVFFSYIFPKFLLISLLVLIFTGLVLLYLLINRIHLSSDEFFCLWVYAGIVIILSCFFFLMGTLAGSLKSKVAGLTSVVIAWFIFMIFIPGGVSKIVAKLALKNIPSFHKLENEKLEILLNFEKEAREELNKCTGTEERKKKRVELIERYWEKEFKQIQSIEKRMQKKMVDNSKYYRWLSILSPTTFYSYITGEMGGQGYRNYFNFYEFAQRHREKFLRYYFDKKRYSDSSNVEPYIKGDENIFYSRSLLPVNIGWGILLLLLYILILLFLSFIRFKKMLYRVSSSWNLGYKNSRLDIKKGKLNVIHVRDRRFSQQIYNLLTGNTGPLKQKGYQDKIFLEGRDLMHDEEELKFVHLVRFEEIPWDLRVKDYFCLSGLKYVSVPGGLLEKCIGDLTIEDKETIYLSIFKQMRGEIFLIEDICKGLAIEVVIEIIDRMESLSAKGTILVYLTTDVSPAYITERKYSYRKDDQWIVIAKSYKEEFLENK